MKSDKYFCSRCGLEHTVIDKNNGIKLTEITCLICPTCNIKMFKIKEDCTKHTKLNREGGNKNDK